MQRTKDDPAFISGARFLQTQHGQFPIIHNLDRRGAGLRLRRVGFNKLLSVQSGPE